MGKGAENSEPKKSVDISRLAKTLCRFYGDDVVAAKQAIEAYLLNNPQASKNEIFNILAAGKGQPSTHTGAHADTQQIHEGEKYVQGSKRKSKHKLKLPLPRILKKRP